MKEKYGNGTHTEYSYDPARRWLRTIKTQNKGGIQFQNMSYEFDPVGNVNGYENDCLDKAHGNYKTCQNYEYDGLYQLTRATGETIYNPYKSLVPEYVSTYEQKFEFDSDGLGNMMKKVSSEKVSPKRTIGDNLNYTFNYEYNPAYAHRLKNVGNIYYLYDDNGNVICEQDGSFESNGDDTTYRKITEEAENVYSSNYGWGLWREEVGGKSNGRYRRTYSWNERNQLVCSQDSRYFHLYHYAGNNPVKYTDPDGRMDITSYYIPDLCSYVKGSDNRLAVPLGGNLTSTQKDITKIQGLMTLGFSMLPDVGSFTTVPGSDFSVNTVISLTETVVGMISETAGMAMAFVDLLNIIASDPDVSAKNYSKDQIDFIGKCSTEQLFIKDYSDALTKKGIMNSKTQQGSFIMNLEIYDVPLYSDVLIQTANEVKNSKPLYKDVEINY